MLFSVLLLLKIAELGIKTKIFFTNRIVYIKNLYIFVRINHYFNFMEATSNEFLRGTLKTIVLKLLAEHGRMYGYEITQSVKDRTNGEITLTFGALYPVLHKLEQEGFLLTESEEVDGRLRKYYTLTPSGSATAIQKVSEFERFVEAMQILLKPTEGGLSLSPL
jgi:PadR family transcriptional regulator PadR